MSCRLGIRKRMLPSSSVTTTSLEDAPDLTSESEYEEPRLGKRRRPVQQRAGSVFSTASTPKPTPSPSLSGQLSSHRGDQNPSRSFLNREGNEAVLQSLQSNDLYDNAGGDLNAYVQGKAEVQNSQWPASYPEEYRTDKSLISQRDYDTIPMRVSRRATLSQLQQLYQRRIDDATGERSSQVQVSAKISKNGDRIILTTIKCLIS